MRPRHGRCKACLAKQTRECACAKAGQICPAEPDAGARSKHETSVEPRILRILGRASAPARARRIAARSSPDAVRELLGDIFVLSYDAAAGYPFRVAGTRVCALLGCDLKDRSFSALFAAGRPPRDRGHHHGRSRGNAGRCRRHYRDVAGRLAGASGIAAVAVQCPRPHAAEPDRIAGAVRTRTRPCCGTSS